jgi:hypothetical protein
MEFGKMKGKVVNMAVWNGQQSLNDSVLNSGWVGRFQAYQLARWAATMPETCAK